MRREVGINKVVQADWVGSFKVRVGLQNEEMASRGLYFMTFANDEW